MNKTRFALLLAALAVVGCSNTHLRSAAVQVPHNPDATRTWWVFEDGGGNQHVLMCDVALIQAGRPLCLSYP